jgi:hypothetical protein
MTDIRDIGTPELAKRRRIQPRLKAGRGYDYDLYVVDGSGPDKLLSDGKIGTNEHATFLAFTVLMHKANMLGPKSPAMERVTNSDPSFVSQKVADAMRRVSVVISRLDQKIGRKAREEVVNLCMLDTPLSNASLAISMANALRDSLDGN